jgi:hypothetical protein
MGQSDLWVPPPRGYCLASDDLKEAWCGGFMLRVIVWAGKGDNDNEALGRGMLPRDCLLSGCLRKHHLAGSCARRTWWGFQIHNKSRLLTVILLIYTHVHVGLCSKISNHK